MTLERIAYSVREAGELTGYGERSIRKAIGADLLKASRPGGIGDYRIFSEDLYAWVGGAGVPEKVRPASSRRTRAPK